MKVGHACTGVAFELRCVPFRTFNSFLQWLQVLMLIPKPVKSDMLCDAQLKLPVGSYPTPFCWIPSFMIRICYIEK